LRHLFVDDELAWPIFFYKAVEHYGLSFAFVLMCIPNARRFYSAEQLRENDRQEAAWMRENSTSRETLEARIYNDLALALANWTDVFDLFDAITPMNSRCAGTLCDNILKDYPLDAERLQYKLFIRALQRSLKPDMASPARFHAHCRAVHDDMRTLPHLTLSVPKILAAVTASLCEGHSDPRVNDAYNSIQDAVDDGEAFDFKLVQTTLTRELKKPRAGSRHALRDDARALRSIADAPSNSKCPGCAGCSLHCVDSRSGKWRAAPSASSRGHGTFLTVADSDDDRHDRDVTQCALRRVERAAGEARAMILARSFDSSASDEGPSIAHSDSEDAFEDLRG
jgi:hypothetical protein